MTTGGVGSEDINHPGGMFVNLEHVASPTEARHRGFLDVDTQVDGLRTIGFDDGDCRLTYDEVAMFAGTRPAGRPA